MCGNTLGFWVTHRCLVMYVHSRESYDPSVPLNPLSSFPSRQGYTPGSLPYPLQRCVVTQGYVLRSLEILIRKLGPGGPEILSYTTLSSNQTKYWILNLYIIHPEVNERFTIPVRTIVYHLLVIYNWFISIFTYFFTCLLTSNSGKWSRRCHRRTPFKGVSHFTSESESDLSVLVHSSNVGPPGLVWRGP